MVETKGQRVERLRMCAREELKAMLKIARWLHEEVETVWRDVVEEARR